VFAALGIQYAMRMRDVVIYGVSASTIFFFSHCLTNGTMFEKEIIESKHVF
jgi:hypothetical protein